MKPLIELSHLILRIYTGVALAFLATANLLDILATSGRMGSNPIYWKTGLMVVDVLQVVLLAMLGLWICLGIRTRVVATFGAIFLTTHAIRGMAHAADPSVSGNLAVVLFLASVIFSLVILAKRGGGLFAAYSRGWQGLKL